MKIILDPGHGGKDPGAILGNRTEKNDVLRLTLEVGKILETQSNAEIAYTRKTDVYNSPSEKASIANTMFTSMNDIFISFHRNASDNNQASGAEVYVYSMKNITAKIATKICNCLQNNGFVTRGVKTGKNLIVLNQTKMPAMLLEVGFITNNTDNSIFDEKFDYIATIIADSIMDELNIKKQITTSNKNIRYCGHVQNKGWGDWVEGGIACGTVGESLRLEGVLVQLFNFPPETYIIGRTHIENIGWSELYSNGKTIFLGSIGESKRLEAFSLSIKNDPGHIKYKAHIQDIGWTDFVRDGEVCGTTGQSKRIEAVSIIYEP